MNILIILLAILAPIKAYAMCPICTIAVGSALVLLESYGVDNTISGLWIGALTVSMSVWTINWLKNKKWNTSATSVLVFIFYYLMIIVPLYFSKIIGLPDKRLLGIDKVILGMIIGSLFFYLGDLLYIFIKKQNNSKPWFPFQKTFMPILPLILLTIFFYYITK